MKPDTGSKAPGPEPAPAAPEAAPAPRPAGPAPAATAPAPNPVAAPPPPPPPPPAPAPPPPPPEPNLRSLPSVEKLAQKLDGGSHPQAVMAARRTISAARAAMIQGEDPPFDLEADARARLERLRRPSQRPVINATGVIIHTNLGRSPLHPEALLAVTQVAGGYSNLEYDIESGRRGSRHSHVETVLRELTGAESALVVNNCAAAVLLATSALAAGREVVISRGQLVEIGGSFRIPDVIQQSGARLVEVGTTNRTSLADYTMAIGPETGLIMRAHPSNFRAVGFVQEVQIEQLCELGRKADLPVVDDTGSGNLEDDLLELAEEPPVRRSVAAGCAVVCFSGDKLFGGPQAGVMVGREEAIEACRTHPLARAMRIDKLSLAALEATARIHLDPERAARELPILKMLRADRGELEERAQLMWQLLRSRGVDGGVTQASGRVGGGTLPLLELEGPVCAVDPGDLGAEELARRLRTGRPPVVARVREGYLLLDPRTLDDDEARLAAVAVLAALGD